MTIGTPVTWASGNALTATKVKDEVEDQFNALFSPPRAKLFSLSTASIASQAATTLHTTVAAGNLIGFTDVEAESYIGSMTTGTSPWTRLIAPVAGIYIVSAHGTFAANATSGRGGILRLNGTTWIDADIRPASPTASGVAPGPGGSTGTTSVTVTVDQKMAANDYVEFFMNQASGGALNTQSSWGYLELLWIGNSA